MREIKFKLWHKNPFGNPSFTGSHTNGLNFDLSAGQIYCNGLNVTEYYEILQFTGLTDKNGKEIYEGDIVQCTHWFFDGNEVEENFSARVGFKNGSFTLEDIDSRFYSNYTGEENGKGICWIGDINYCEDDYEVIGNIYEATL
jgi:uncharacterized phage protein (TIGR01671 family)